MIKNLSIPIKSEKHILKDGDFLIERSSQKDFLNKRYFEIESGANVSYLMIVDSPVQDKVLRNWEIKSYSKLQSYRLFLNDKFNNAWFFNHNIEEGSKIESKSLVIALKQEKVNLKAVYNFIGRDSFGRINSEALIAGESQVNFHSDVNILRTAQKSDTRVDMTLRLENTEAKGEMIPSLNISANDVKAGHSAGTFRLKDEDLFYLRSRGLSQEKIRSLFINSLANNFISDLNNDELKEEIVNLINNNL